MENTQIFQQFRHKPCFPFLNRPPRYHGEQRQHSWLGPVTNFMLNLYFDKINFVKCLFFVGKKKKYGVFIEVCGKFSLSLMENTDFSLSALFTKYNKSLHPSNTYLKALCR